MNRALPNQTFYSLNKGKHQSEVFKLSNESATVYVSTHFELGNSDLLHFHEEPHLTFILNGGLKDKRKRFETERFSGELMFFQAGEPHQTITKTFPTKYFTLQFQNNFFKKFTTESKLTSAVEKNPNIKFELLKLYRELLVNDEFSNISVEMLLYNVSDEKEISNEKIPAWLTKTVEMLNDLWNEEISLADLAKAANVHPKTISRYFPKYFKCTLGEYRRKIKIEKSLAMIKNSKLSLTEIAYECGFYDQSHFTAAFRNLTGFRPKQFQKL